MSDGYEAIGVTKRAAEFVILHSLERAGFQKLTPSALRAFELMDISDLGPTELCKALGVSQQYVSKTLAVLLEAGLVSRSYGAMDKRTRTYIATPDGRRALKVYRDSRRRVDAAIGDDLSGVCQRLSELADAVSSES